MCRIVELHLEVMVIANHYDKWDRRRRGFLGQVWMRILWPGQPPDVITHIN